MNGINRMDHKIYGQTQVDYGRYATRRYPKGNSSGAGAGTGADTPVAGAVPESANPVAIALFSSSAGIADHAATVRWEYTVPRYRRARIDDIYTHIRVETAGATNNSSIGVTIQRRGSTSFFTLIGSTLRDGANVNFQETNQTPGPIELFEGDTIRATSIGAGGGTKTYVAAAHLIEFDSIQRAGYKEVASVFGSGSGTIFQTASQPSVPQPGYIGTGGINQGVPIV
jgi:hypothetical protein